jgi:hypothetical protein
MSEKLLLYKTVQKIQEIPQLNYNILITHTEKKDYYFIYFSNTHYTIENNTIFINVYNVKMKLFDFSNNYYNNFFKFIKYDEIKENKINFKYLKYMFFLDEYKPDFIIFMKIHNNNLFEHILTKHICQNILSQISMIKIENKIDLQSKNSYNIDFNVIEYLNKRILELSQYKHNKFDYNLNLMDKKDINIISDEYEKYLFHVIKSIIKYIKTD